MVRDRGLSSSQIEVLRLVVTSAEATATKCGCCPAIGGCLRCTESTARHTFGIHSQTILTNPNLKLIVVQTAARVSRTTILPWSRAVLFACLVTESGSR